MEKQVVVTKPAETEALGEQLAQQLQPGDVILLDGDLGAGKTTFTKGIARGLGIRQTVKSPSFPIIREYQSGRLPLYHMDVYRLETGGAADLGLDEYFAGDGVSVVEWSQFAETELPEHYLQVAIERQDDVDADQRRLTLRAHGDRFETLLAQLGFSDE
ncbi:tRNA (adenosine(37)-N6)-threonylcarbamoyltransferase complex ATPase subunit type 1 TsaE [Fructilactobacillus cliffordii]|uniref:tRNA (adenosine(37)-N6)-threonylcarbamoyltransferase complex ATPase subunit type 1 TsaE n=1 Tax=Fructilactobacillus cliffordii TaxID=2940299 RepID=UPI0020931FC1|nr:tRNA (adenosine(37)-N6)-threonylcarbamoyltransferase complex ATPase subunit type 1 TsaE [Fructilactobacillus cliffordii]USS86939.1 tRNA (adenosine(37)-N6)-threonylcarbamoyltransferase complex ATPase subunit type 1 TsaE [Fructilactobacillus cliffordii]